MTDIVMGNVTGMRDEIERLRTALQQIEQWAAAYPVAVFPEPDFTKVRALLEEGGMTLDAVSASSMRHALKGVGKIAREALGESPP